MNSLCSNTAFAKRTRKGKVIRITHSACLRDDLDCGYLHGVCLTSDAICEIAKHAPHQHILVVDTNIALHQIDVLDHKAVTLVVIVLSTVMQELKHLNLSVYRRLLSLLKDESRMFVLFPNDLSASSNAIRSNGETINDFNDRLIRKATDYYASVATNNASVILITNDVGNQKKAVEEKLVTYSISSYVHKFLAKGFPEIVDLLALSEISYSNSGSNANATTSSSTIMRADKSKDHIFKSHISTDEVMKGLQCKKYLKGILRCKRDDCFDCYVVVHADDGSRKSVAVLGGSNVNRAIDGDQVAFEIIASNEGLGAMTDANASNSSSGSGSKRKNGGKDNSVTKETMVIPLLLLEPSIESIEGTSKAVEVVYGRVVGIIKRNSRQYAGSIDTSGLGDCETAEGADSVLFHPIDKRIPAIRIVTRRRQELLNKRLLVAIDSWPSTSPNPLGHYIRSIGNTGEKNVETEALLLEFDVSHEAFSHDVMACLPPGDWKITSDVIAKRTDLRHLPIVSIDPPGCKDIDDALHCIQLSNGNLQIGVHIADVTFFVHPESAIDKEAAHRSTSTYLVERRLDMLPGLLTTQLCSLRSTEDHLAFSVIWEMTPNGSIVDVTFFKSVIHSVASLTYDEAQCMLDDNDEVISKYGTHVAKSVMMLNVIARILRSNRVREGALTLASPEVRFKLDSADDSNPLDVNMYNLKEANALVEEFMLLANITVSKKILRHYPTLAVLRRHQPPSREQFLPLVSAAQAVGCSININSSKALADSLDAAVRPNDPYFNKLLRILSTRCMMPAQYFCSGEIPIDQWHHYGLAAPVYTHFTSPIRRYADIIVHRLLSAAIGVISLPAVNADRSKQQELCSFMNRRHSAAQYAQRASTSLYTLLFFKINPSIETAYILTVTVDSITVLVPKFGVEDSICMDNVSITDYDHTSHTVTTAPQGRTYQVFQQVQVSIRVQEESTGSRKLIIELHDDSGSVNDNGSSNSSSNSSTSSSNTNYSNKKKKKTK